ncbi:MAG: C1 family peptidase [Saprospiraceae bacterium]|nr:C1 family peptidase [Saprospiraceae bacterium]
MAIRMTPDHPQEPDPRKRQQPDRPTQPDQGEQKGPLAGIPIWVRWLPLLLWFLIKKPKYLLPVLIGLGIYYFLVKPTWNQILNFEYTAQDEGYSYGAELSEEEYDKAYVFEPLSVGAGGVPVRVDLEDFSPQILHQGRQGSCSGWASAYAARTISYAQATGSAPDQVAFSPSFLYNQIALPRCQGAYLRNAMEFMTKVGALPFKDFGYTDETCQIQPDPYDQQTAAAYKIKGYTRLSRGANDYQPDLFAVKQHLAQNAPVVIGMMVGQSFQHAMMGQALWRPSQQEYAGFGLSGHAMCLVGYDDEVAGGAFRVMNSWGERWGDGGFSWIRYSDFEQFTKEAYGLYPEGRANVKKFDRDRLEVTFGLVDNATTSLIPLEQINEITFRTERPLRKGDRFKIIVDNAIECYIYVLGMETTGSSYVLFPYTEKHSPYCGITGQRLFPKDYSMELDVVGNRDYMAVIVSKDPLNIDQVNRQMNQNTRADYTERLVEALFDQFVLSCDFDVDGAVRLDCPIGERNALGMVIEVDKM